MHFIDKQQASSSSHEEVAILREMRATQKRLEKNRQLEEWSMLKKERSRRALLERELKQQLIREDAKEREARRQARVSQNKQKLQSYHEQVMKETEQLKELHSVGLDITALMRNKSRYGDKSPS